MLSYMDNLNKNHLIYITLAIVTVFVIFLAIILSFAQTYQSIPEISSITPANGSQNVNLNENIVIGFQKELTAKNQANFQLSLAPAVESQAEWTDNKTYTIQPISGLELKTPYTLNIKYKDKIIASSSFTTKTAENLTEAEQIEQQAIDDYQYQQELNRVYDNNLWLLQLPIDTNDYTIVYDFEKNHLRVRVKQKITADERIILQKQISDLLASKGIPDTIPLFWIESE